MKQITLDFETYYDSEYSLRKMTPVEYILDPRFEVIGCAVKEGDAKSFWLPGEDLRGYLAGLQDRIVVISHNALFDMCILCWHFDYVPHMMVDTLGMARAWLQHRLKSLSLASVATYYGIGAKGTTVHKVLGMSAAAIRAAGFYDEYASYSCNDADLCWDIYRKMVAEGFPANEVAVMDTVLRCAVQPAFVLDPAILAEHLHAVQVSKEELMGRVGLTGRDELLSNDKFADALRRLGVEPPTKVSVATGQTTYAFAKTDAALMDLEEHENPDVQALVAARLGIKSTLEETRTQRLISISNLQWPPEVSPRGNPDRGPFIPMALRYSGAHTHRLSGDWKLNVQNLPRGGALRRAIKAPRGKVVVAEDASQIEARLAAWFCGADTMTNAFAAKEDVYSTFASAVFGYPVKKSTHPVERFLGKTAVLGLQYGLGWVKFQSAVGLKAKSELGQELNLSDEESQRVVNTYRRTYKEIPAMWRLLESLIPRMTGKNFSYQLGPVTFEHERIRLPSGLYLNYHNLRYEGDQWVFDYAGRKKYIYGGKMLENIIQALARICVMDAAVRVRRRIGARLQLQVHDELVYVVDEPVAQSIKDVVHEEMIRRPDWGPDIPLAAEGDIGASYGDAK